MERIQAVHHNDRTRRPSGPATQRKHSWVRQSPASSLSSFSDRTQQLSALLA
jgi:hypothetical protein